MTEGRVMNEEELRKILAAALLSRMSEQLTQGVGLTLLLFARQ
jgi:hypothetical protein